MPLSDSTIRNAKPSEKTLKLKDTNGLYIEIKPNGSKLWRYRYRIGGKENVYAIGKYPNIGLADARTEREHARKLVKQGIHPAHNRQLALSTQIAENENTFKAIAIEWMEAKKVKKGWTQYYANQVKHVMETDVFPHVGTLPIRNITSAHMLTILERIEKRGAHTVALLARQWSSAVFAYAIGKRKTDNDPMYILRGTIERPKVQHNKPLQQKEIPVFLRKLEEYGCRRETYIATRLLMLTFVRTGELRAATWDEFDFDNAEWRIPAHRMKMRDEHIVPLSVQSVKLLNELKSLTGHQKWLFPNVRRPLTCMTATTLNRVIERLGYAGKFSAHGFRGTASTILNEFGYLPDAIERQLAHSPRNKVRAIYNQAQYLQDRRAMMQEWANFIDDLLAGSKVAPSKREAAHSPESI